MSDSGFKLHTQLAADTIEVIEWPLSSVLLMNNATLPWLILVPRRLGIRECYELNQADQAQLSKESSLLAQALMQEFDGDKMNIAALGNMVPQLHIHHIVRFQYDPVWPQPVWGNLPAKTYSADKRKRMLERLTAMLKPISV